mmetsp:Transcript_13241/g.25733  ORF Transcript_13241/g.25733 Transcript_13241/m.25733 type:complete len:86 (-) Transcript_13241:156-413(-)
MAIGKGIEIEDRRFMLGIDGDGEFATEDVSSASNIDSLLLHVRMQLGNICLKLQQAILIRHDSAGRSAHGLACKNSQVNRCARGW